MREIDLEFRAADERKRLDHNDRAWLAWNIYALPLQKTPRPTLAALQIKPATRSTQTPEQRLAVAQAWAAVLSKR